MSSAARDLNPARDGDESASGSGPGNGYGCAGVGHRFITAADETYCASCGLVAESVPIMGEEFKTTPGVTLKRPRLGGSLWRGGIRDGNGIRIAPRMKKSMARSTWHRQDRHEREAAMVRYVRAILSRAEADLRLPPAATTQTEATLRTVIQRRLFRGRSRETVVAAALALNLWSPRWRLAMSAGEIAKACGADKIQMLRAMQMLRKELRIYNPPIGVVDLLRLHAESLRLGPEERKILQEWLSDPDIGEVAGAKPSCILAAAVYVLSRRLGSRVGVPASSIRSQEFIGGILRVSTVSIRDHVSSIEVQLRASGRW